MGNSRAAGAIALFGSPFLTIVIYREAVKESGELTVRPRVTGRRYQGTVVVIQGEIQEKTGADVNGAGWAEMTGCDQHWCSSKHRQKGGCTVLLSPTAKSKWFTGRFARGDGARVRRSGTHPGYPGEQGRDKWQIACPAGCFRAHGTHVLQRSRAILFTDMQGFCQQLAPADTQTACAVDLFYLGPAAEPVGQDHVFRGGSAQCREQDPVRSCL